MLLPEADIPILISIMYCSLIQMSSTVVGTVRYRTTCGENYGQKKYTSTFLHFELLELLYYITTIDLYVVCTVKEKNLKAGH